MMDEWKIEQNDGFTSIHSKPFANGWLVMTRLWNKDKTEVKQVKTIYVPDELYIGFDPDDPEPDEAQVVKLDRLKAIAGQA